ncbi:MAG: HAD-IA family hydrolase [Firmicutes bacterium]|nr:HAD-IA family hydrolase [Bacillota bacterium]
MHIETLFLDVGGVVLLPNDAYWTMLKERYHAPEAVESLFYGAESPWADCRVGVIDRRAYNERMAQLLNVEADTLEALRWSWEWVLNEPLIEWLRTHLSQWRRIIAVSNADDYLERQLQHFRVADLFDAVINSCRVGAAKPDRLIYEKALEATTSDPACCLFVDDREANLETAAALGMKTILYTTFSEFIDHLTRMLDADTLQE